MGTPKAAFRVRVDWDRDGDFTDANSDVTADVLTRLGMKYNRGRRFPSYNAQASMLELSLNNSSHKYSPSNKSGAIYPLVFPGPEIWVEMAYPMDDFNAADATTLASRKPPYDDLFAAWSGDTGDFDVLSNKLRTPSGGDYQAVLDFGESDCYVAVSWTYPSTGGQQTHNSGLILRYTDTNNYLLFFAGGTTINLQKVDGGTKSTLHGPAAIKKKDGTAFTWAGGEEHRLGVEMHGDQVRLFVDDIFQASVTTTFNQTATKHGVGGKNTELEQRWEDFGGWRSVFYGRVDAIQPRPEVTRQYTYIRAFDDLERMRQHQVFKTAPTGGSVTAAALLDVVHDAIDASSQNRIFDTGTTLTLDDKHEASMGRDALTETLQVQDDDAGFYYVDGHEVYRYEDAAHRDAGPHTTSLKTFKSGGSTPGVQTDIFFTQDRFEWMDGKDAVENEIYYQYHRISRVTATETWRLETGDRPAIADGETLTFLAVGDGDNIANPRTPLHTSDFTMNTLKDGTGTNLTAAVDSQQGTVSLSGSAAFTIDDTTQDFTAVTSGDKLNDGKHVIRLTDNTGRVRQAWIGTDNPDADGTKVTLYTTSALTTKGYITGDDSGFSEADTPITYNVYEVTAEIVSGFDGNFRRIAMTNRSGSAGFITFLRLLADKGTKTSKTAARAENTASQTDVGRRRVEHETLHIDNFDRAALNARLRLDARVLRKERLTLSMANATRACLMQIVHRSISDRIQVIYSDMDINDTYYIEGFEVTVSEGGLFVQCDWLLKQTESGNVDHARVDQMQVF